MSGKSSCIKYVFIDSQNLNLGVSRDILKKEKIVYRGWKLDYRKFMVYLCDKFRINKVFLFIGYIEKNKYLYKQLKKYGYNLVFKPTVMDKNGRAKGNVDAELVLYTAAIEYEKYDKAIIVSGDGDFYCLHKFLEDRGKLEKIVIPNAKSASSLLKKFQKYKVFIEFEKEKLERK